MDAVTQEAAPAVNADVERRARMFRQLLDTAASAIAHPGRRRILEMLAVHGELSPGELAAAFPGVDRRSVSKQLQLLLRAGLVTVRRRQRFVIDRRDPPEVQALKSLNTPVGPGVALLYALERPGLGVLRYWLEHAFWPDAPPAAGAFSAAASGIASKPRSAAFQAAPES